MEMTTGLDEEAARLGMIVAYLDDAAGDWAEGCGCSIADQQNVNDLGFARALTNELAPSYTLDPDRIYAVGFSIGGLFVQRLACEASDLFAAVVTVSATMSTPLSQTCRPSEPISVMILHGTADPVFPWEGTQNGTLSLLSARAAIDQWRTHDACPEEPRVTEQPINTSLSIREVRYAPCQSETEVRLIAVEGGRHVWYQGTFSTSKRVVAFLAAQQPQPAPAP